MAFPPGKVSTDEANSSHMGVYRTAYLARGPAE